MHRCLYCLHECTYSSLMLALFWPVGVPQGRRVGACGPTPMQQSRVITKARDTKSLMLIIAASRAGGIRQAGLHTGYRTHEPMREARPSFTLRPFCIWTAGMTGQFPGKSLAPRAWKSAFPADGCLLLHRHDHTAPMLRGFTMLLLVARLLQVAGASGLIVWYVARAFIPHSRCRGLCTDCACKGEVLQL